MNRRAFAKVIKKARDAANEAAKKRYDEISKHPGQSECGGAHMGLILEDKKSRRFFDSLLEKPLRGLEVTGGRDGLYFISIRDMRGYQEAEVGFAAALAAMQLFEEETGGKKWLRAYFS